MFKYRVWSYEVWGNDEDGYSVNDRSEIDNGTLEHFPTDDELKDIIENNWYSGLIQVDESCSDERNIEIVLKENEYYPVGQIEIECE